MYICVENCYLKMISCLQSFFSVAQLERVYKERQLIWQIEWIVCHFFKKKKKIEYFTHWINNALTRREGHFNVLGRRPMAWQLLSKLCFQFSGNVSKLGENFYQTLFAKKKKKQFKNKHEWKKTFKLRNEERRNFSSLTFNSKKKKTNRIHSFNSFFFK